MKEKKKLHSWDWIPKWDDDNAAVSEDVQEQGKDDMGQWPQKLGQQYLSMLGGGEYPYTPCKYCLYCRKRLTITSFNLKYT